MNNLRTGNGQRGRIGDRSRPVADLTSVISVVRRGDIVYGQDAAEDRVVVYLDAGLGPRAQLVAVPRPANVQRLISLAAGAHQLGAHSLRYIVFEVKRRYPGRYYKGG